MELEVAQYKLSYWGTVFSIVNVFLGMCVLSMPYAFSKAKWWSPLCLAIVSVMACYTAYVLVLASQRAATTIYTEIGMMAANVMGEVGVQWMVGLQFVTAPMMFLIFMWDNTKFCLPEFNYLTLCIIEVIAVTPLCWFLNFGEMAFLNTIGVICTIVFVIGVFVSYFQHMGEPVPIETLEVTSSDLVLALGIMILGQADHAAIPNIYRDMEDKSKFKSALIVSFIIIYIGYCLVGLAGWQSYGDNTQILLTGNFKDFPGGSIFYLTTILTIIRTYVTIPPFLAILCELFENYFLIEEARSKKIFRSCSLYFLAIISFLTEPFLNFIESLTGALPSCVAAFVFPCFFYLNLPVFPDQTEYFDDFDLIHNPSEVELKKLKAEKIISNYCSIPPSSPEIQISQRISFRKMPSKPAKFHWLEKSLLWFMVIFGLTAGIYFTLNLILQMVYPDTIPVDGSSAAYVLFYMKKINY